MADMYFKVPVDSPTGRKFKAIVERRSKAFEDEKAMGDKYGFTEYRGSRLALWGGIETAIFPGGNPDARMWKKEPRYGRNEYSPRRNTPEGIALYKEFEAMTMVRRNDLNEIVGFNDPFCQACIGFAYHRDDYFGVIVIKRWKCKITSDMEEIKASEYDALFGSADDTDDE